RPAAALVAASPPSSPLRVGVGRCLHVTRSGEAVCCGKHVRSFHAAFAIPESSSRFTPGDRARARALTGLSGDPCVLWVGRLTRGKDPLTVLEGIALAASRLPGLRLWCAFGAAPMLVEVRARIADDPRLAGRVHLLGEAPHARIETLLQAADLYVSGSRVEGSGYAALEAIACGV